MENTLMGNNVLTTWLPDFPHTLYAAITHTTANVAQHAYEQKQHW